MKQNVGTLDRLIRSVLGLLLIGLVTTDTISWWGWIGVVPLASGFVGFCVVYALPGWKRNRVRKQENPGR
ncbi:MAG: DUF2892 domain-containing protein [Zoogloeaceae bacterium]|jgi:hypothetical protein|nr:DUF2892 domain-containing protein [Zoogloeaceae bacterium]